MKFFGKVVLIVFILLAIIFCIFGNDIYDNKRLTNCTEVTTGTITDFSRPGRAASGRGFTLSSDYSVSATFKINGITYKCTGKTDHLYNIGGQIEVHYNPSDPDLAYCGTGPRSPFSNAMLWIGSLVIGCVFAVVGYKVRGNRFGNPDRYASMSSY